MCREAVGYVGEGDEAVVAVHVHRQYASSPDVERRQREEDVA